MLIMCPVLFWMIRQNEKKPAVQTDRRMPRGAVGCFLCCVTGMCYVCGAGSCILVSICQFLFAASRCTSEHNTAQYTLCGSVSVIQITSQKLRLTVTGQFIAVVYLSSFFRFSQVFLSQRLVWLWNVKVPVQIPENASGETKSCFGG